MNAPFKAHIVAAPVRLDDEPLDSRLMAEVRQYAIDNAEQIEAEWNALTDPRDEIRAGVAAAKARADAEWAALPDILKQSEIG